jgi:hypothetical protein
MAGVKTEPSQPDDGNNGERNKENLRQEIFEALTKGAVKGAAFRKLKITPRKRLLGDGFAKATPASSSRGAVSARLGSHGPSPALSPTANDLVHGRLERKPSLSAISTAKCPPS